MSQSASREFWLNSGALLFFEGGFGRTIQGELPSDDPWRLAYARSNPGDTDGGFHPQNVFRLVTRQALANVGQRLTFRIARIHASASANRNASNGVFLFQHYLDGDNLYVGGIRVDGNAVIKKKIAGRNFTMGIAGVFPGGYDRSRNPSVLPQDRSIALETHTRSEPDGTVTIQVQIDGSLVLQANDDGRSFGGRAIAEPGLIGIRTDFMDVTFSEYRVSPE